MKYVATFLSVLFCTSIAFGQILDRTENRAKNKVNNRVDRKIDSGIDSGLDALEGVFKKKNKNKEKEIEQTDEVEMAERSGDSETRVAETNTSAYSSSTKIEDDYTFNHNLKLNIQSFDKKGKAQEAMDMKMYFSDSEANFGMELNASGAESFVIYDMASYQMISLIDANGQKIGMSMKIDPEKMEKQMSDAEEKNKSEAYSFVKTGDSKVISGFKCEAYKMDGPDSNEWDQTLWMTEDTDADWMGYMSNMMATNKKMQGSYQMPENYPKGSVIQIISESTKNQEKTIMTVKEIHKNQPKTFSTNGYKFMNFPGMGGN